MDEVTDKVYPCRRVRWVKSLAPPPVLALCNIDVEGAVISQVPAPSAILPTMVESSFSELEAKQTLQ